jgi:hypothetical protein
MTHRLLFQSSWIVVSVAALALGAFSLPGCPKIGDEYSKARGSWHAKVGWRAEEYFDDPMAIALCKAIEAEDLDEIDRLVAAGADVNAIGKGKMTPLLWAFPENKLRVFKRVLEHGANPKVCVESDFGTRSFIVPGDSVTHLAARTWSHYFKCVMQHGGDPNLVDAQLSETPLFSVIKGQSTNKKEGVQLLIDAGADLNFISGQGVTPAMLTATWGGLYGITLQLLEAGADPAICQAGSNRQLVHMVIEEERGEPSWSAEQREEYGRLVEWLKAHGVPFDKAKAEVVR